MSKLDEARLAAEADLATFIHLVDPHRLLGHIHYDVLNWWERPDAKSHQLLLLPREHMKSALVAFRVAWYLTRDPTLRVLYVSSTSGLAVKQLYFIKSILTSPVYKRYWPEHIQGDGEALAKWTESEIMLDHPSRKELLIRDPSILSAGLTTSVTGYHCDIAVLDDVVVTENAYTQEGRDKVQRMYSLLSSVETTGALEWVVGTRYHPKDLYNDMVEMNEDVYDKDGELISQEPVYDVMQQVVEDRGDGTGNFLWPRQRRSDGKWFGFNSSVLAKKRAQYLDKTQFRAQYYNNPTDPDNRPIDYDKFQYFDPNLLKEYSGNWYYKDRRLNVYAAIDFAFSVARKADYTSIVVIGIDEDSNIYVLDIDRFKTEKISDYYKHLMQMMNRWSFKKLRAEVNVAQAAVVKELKDMYLRPNGISLKIDEKNRTRHEGNKEERMAAVLEPRYDNLMVWHRRGGNWQILEEELVSNSPPHDDVKDALASAIEIAVRPTPMLARNNITRQQNVVYHPRFGGRAF